MASIPDERITLTAADIDWTYENFYLQVNKSKRYFDWKNVVNEFKDNMYQAVNIEFSEDY